MGNSVEFFWAHYWNVLVYHVRSRSLQAHNDAVALSVGVILAVFTCWWLARRWRQKLASTAAPDESPREPAA